MEAKLLAECQQLNDLLSQNQNEDNFKGFAEYFTDDCKTMPPGSDCITGREGVTKISEFIKKELPYTKNVIKALEVIPFGDDFALQRGVYTLYKDGELLDEGKLVLFQKRINGKWLIHYNIFNSNKPSGGVTAAVDKE